MFRTRCKISEEVDEHRGMRDELWADHARSFRTAEEVDGSAFDLKAGMSDFELGVGGEDRSGEGFGVFGCIAECGFGGGNCGGEFFDRQRNADDAGGRREDLIEDAAELLGDSDAALAAGVDARFAGSAVGVARIDEDGGYAATSCGEMSASDCYRCSDELIAGEEGGSAGSAVADCECNIGLAAGFDTGFDGGPSETEGEGIGRSAHQPQLYQAGGVCTARSCESFLYCWMNCSGLFFSSREGEG
jgi:hypothetical protein